MCNHIRTRGACAVDTYYMLRNAVYIYDVTEWFVIATTMSTVSTQ